MVTLFVNNVTTSIRFFQDNIHERTIAAKFSIHIFPDPRPFKYYNYFDFSDFFDCYQAKKADYTLDVGRAFHGYLSQADTEIFTVFEKFTDESGKYKGVVNYRVYFLVHGNEYITTLRTENHLNIYITKTFSVVLKRDNKETFFGEIITITNTYNREKIYNGIKFNVQNYGLEPFETRYENLDKFYHKIQIKNAGGTESVSNSLVSHKIVEEGIVKKIKNFNLRKISGDKRLRKTLRF